MKNKYLLLLPIFLFSFAFISGAYSGSGSGSEGDPFLITTCSQLQEVGSYVGEAYSWTHWAVSNNIDCSEIFTPIGTLENPFTGTFNGQGYTLSNIVIPIQNYAGVFGYSTGTIRNVNVIDIGFGTGDATYLGGFVGLNEGLIEDCGVTSSSTINLWGSSYIGGFAGYNSGTINRCSSSVSLYCDYGSTNNYGGFAGYNSGTITNSYSTGNVDRRRDAGGFVGNNVGTISYCYSTGTVTQQVFGTGLGGFANTNGVGGIIENSYATGNVYGTGTASFVVSNSGTISNSYSIGANAESGFVGSNSGSCNNCFWDTETSGQETSACGEGLPTEQMKDYNLFQNAGWTITYEIASENTYPYFQAVNGVETWKIEGVDDVEPIVTEQSPEDNYISETTSVDFTCTATDNGEVTSIELYIDGSSVENYPSNSYTWGAVELSEGEHTWDCYACDSANNCAFGELRTITIDLPTEAETPQAVNKFWDFDIISKQEMLPSDEEAPITKISLFAGIKNFFQSIINWFSNIF